MVQNYLPFFYRIYNISAMKMHPIIFEGDIEKPKCNKDLIGGIRVLMS
jgi:hypothetical protein